MSMAETEFRQERLTQRIKGMKVGNHMPSGKPFFKIALDPKLAFGNSVKVFRQIVRDEPAQSNGSLRPSDYSPI